MATTGNINSTSSAYSDPLLTYMFKLEGSVNGKALLGFFTEISALSEECEVVKFKTIAEKGRPQLMTLPGRFSREPITLKRGITNDATFWDWWKLIKEGKLSKAQTNLTITMYNRKYKPLIKWDLEKAWPSKITTPAFEAGDSNFGVEEITLVYGKLSFEKLKETT
jgi:phage tail-like protein